MINRKEGYGHNGFYTLEYIEYGLIFHTYWKERFYNRLKLRNGSGKSYGTTKQKQGRLARATTSWTEPLAFE